GDDDHRGDDGAQVGRVRVHNEARAALCARRPRHTRQQVPCGEVMEYSFNLKTDKEGMAFAQSYDINASPKDLSAVCTAIRYLRASAALLLLDKIAKMEMPILYKRHSKHMGA